MNAGSILLYLLSVAQKIMMATTGLVQIIITVVAIVYRMLQLVGQNHQNTI